MSAPIRAKFALLSEIYPPIDLDLNAIIYAQNGHISATSLFPVTRFEIKHSRIKMLGGAFNIARGNWLFKTEAAYFDGFEFSNTPNKEYSRLDGLAGVEYSGISDATITLDIANRHYFDFDKRLKDSPDFQKEDLFEWALRITKPYLNDALKLTFWQTPSAPPATTVPSSGFQQNTIIRTSSSYPVVLFFTTPVISGAPWVSGTMIGCIWMFSTVFKIIVNSLKSSY